MVEFTKISARNSECKSSKTDYHFIKFLYDYWNNNSHIISIYNILQKRDTIPTKQNSIMLLSRIMTIITKMNTKIKKINKSRIMEFYIQYKR